MSNPFETKEGRPPASEVIERDRPFDIKYAGRLLFSSFRFSQGDKKLQSEIFKYIHHLHPTWRISKEMQERLVESVSSMAEKFLIHQPNQLRHTSHLDTTIGSEYFGTEIDPGTIEGFVEQEIQKLREKMNSNDTSRNNATLMARRVLANDRKYLLEQGGRVRGKDADPSTPQGDPYLSHLVYYGLQVHPAGVPEYDHMFADITKATQLRARKHKGFRNALEKVISLHNEKHPDSQVDLAKVLEENA